eukprot:c23668_g1_i2 orf=658-2205(-)
MDVLFTSLPLGLSCSPPLRPRHQPHSLICVPVGRDIRHWAVRVVTQSDWVKRTSYCRSRGRIVCTGDSTEDAARKALEQAFSEKKKDFRRWDEEIKNREATSGGGGSRGWSGGGGGGAAAAFHGSCRASRSKPTSSPSFYCDGSPLLRSPFVPLLPAARHPPNSVTLLATPSSHTALAIAHNHHLLPHLKQLTPLEPPALIKTVKTFAPATIANLGPGFDFLGCAVDGLGDYVTAEISEEVPPGTIRIAAVAGDGGRLSYDPQKNCAGIAGRATMELLGVRSVGLCISLHKGLPLGSGLGSSAASAAAAAVAVNALFGSPLTKAELVLAGLESEAAVSGYHADNVAPSLMGGFILVRSYNPLHLIPLPFPADKNLFFVLVNPAFEAPTKKMRAVLPKSISMNDHLYNCSQSAALVSAVLQGDLALLGTSLSSDCIVEPRRSPLIPGMTAVKEAALLCGAYGSTISGAGPTVVAITDSEDKGKLIAARMVETFLTVGKLKSAAYIQRLDRQGARVV